MYPHIFKCFCHSAERTDVRPSRAKYFCFFSRFTCSRSSFSSFSILSILINTTFVSYSAEDFPSPNSLKSFSVCLHTRLTCFFMSFFILSSIFRLPPQPWLTLLFLSESSYHIPTLRTIYCCKENRKSFLLPSGFTEAGRPPSSVFPSASRSAFPF